MDTKESPIARRRRMAKERKTKWKARRRQESAHATNTQSHQFRQSQEDSAQITNIHTHYCGLMDLKMYGWEIVYILRY